MQTLIKNATKQIIDWQLGKKEYHQFYFEMGDRYFFVNPGGSFAYAIPKEKCLIDTDKFKYNESLEENMKANFSGELLEIPPTNNYVKEYKKELKEFYREIEQDERDKLVYVDTKLIAKFKECTYKQVKKSRNGVIFIFKGGELVGLVLPIKRRNWHTV